MTLSVLAIISARGGSDGIPRKNVKMLAGELLIAHTIEQALLAAAVEHLIMSTDDRKIPAISHECGGEPSGQADSRDRLRDLASVR